MKTEPEPASPCVGICLLDPSTGYCRGCLRSVAEIAGWYEASAAEKRSYWPGSISAGSTGGLPMLASDDRPRLPAVAAAFGCLLLTVCTAQTPATVNWVKTGADDATISRELQDCNAQANAALATQQGINADISATLGRNWQLGGTQPVEAQSMRRQAAADADQVLNSCMRAKGFTKAS